MAACRGGGVPSSITTWPEMLTTERVGPKVCANAASRVSANSSSGIAGEAIEISDPGRMIRSYSETLVSWPPQLYTQAQQVRHLRNSQATAVAGTQESGLRTQNTEH